MSIKSICVLYYTYLFCSGCVCFYFYLFLLTFLGAKHFLASFWCQSVEKYSFRNLYTIHIYIGKVITINISRCCLVLLFLAIVSNVKSFMIILLFGACIGYNSLGCYTRMSFLCSSFAHFFLFLFLSFSWIFEQVSTAAIGHVFIIIFYVCMCSCSHFWP